MILEEDFKQVEISLYSKSQLVYSPPISENEGADYGAGICTINNLKTVLRSSKITPKKIGQFVTLWKRDNQGVTTPYSQSDHIDLVIINSRKGNLFGQFIFPMSILIKHKILSSHTSKGKRGFRVYPPWDKAINNQAVKTQSWQLEFFLEITQSPDMKRMKELYSSH